MKDGVDVREDGGDVVLRYERAAQQRIQKYSDYRLQVLVCAK